MSTQAPERPAPAPTPPPSHSLPSLGGRRLRAWWFVLGVLAVLSLARVVSGADQLTSSGTVTAALSATVPIGMAALGGLWAERAGVVNIGLEGMMILGTFGAGWIGWQHGPWAGLVTAVGFGAIGGLVHAVATVSFGVDHIVSGVAVNILGLGVTQYLGSVLLADTPGGGESQSPPIGAVPRVSVPGIDTVFEPVENTGAFLVADLAGLARGLLTDVSAFTLLAVVLVVASAVVLWRTPFGLRLRSCGEEPHAAESLGVNVYRYKYVAVVVSGGLAGFGGAYLAEVAANIYREGQTGGRGYIGLASMIFGNWRPGGLAAGAGLFGYTDALQLRNAAAVHALLLAAAILLALVGVAALARRRYLSGGIWLVVAALVGLWYGVTDSLPAQVVTATPYLTTLVVLALASQRLRPPKADGLVYRRGEE